MIEFKGVHKVYDSGKKALKDVNIRIDKGEFVFIVGESGAGKSTFLKLITREEVPTAGEVIVNGYNLSKLSRKQIPYMRRTMGVVFQDFRLINNMNVFDNVAFAMRVIGASNREIRKRVPYVLQLVGLTDKMRSFPQEMSGGEQQRVSLARALANNPSMIIADEPTGNVDPELSYEIMELLSAVNRLGTTVIVVTHAHDLVEKFDRRVIHISEGVVVSDSGCREIPKVGEEDALEPEETLSRAEMRKAEKAAKKAEKQAAKAEKQAKKQAKNGKTDTPDEAVEVAASADVAETAPSVEPAEPEFKVFDTAPVVQNDALTEAQPVMSEGGEEV